jgi:hypothetical protein
MTTPVSFGGFTATQSPQKAKHPVTNPSQTNAFAVSVKPDRFVRTSGKTTPSAPQFTGHLNNSGDYIHSNGDICESDCENARDARREAKRERRGTLNRIAGLVGQGGDAILGEIRGGVERQQEMNQDFQDVTLHAHIPRIAEFFGIEKKATESQIGFALRTLELARRPTPDQARAWEEKEQEALNKAAYKSYHAKKALPLYAVVDRLKLKLQSYEDQIVAKAEVDDTRRQERRFREFPVVSRHRHSHNNRARIEPEDEEPEATEELQRITSKHSRRSTHRREGERY